jgi:hypothetical protein
MVTAAEEPVRLYEKLAEDLWKRARKHSRVPAIQGGTSSPKADCECSTLTPIRAASHQIPGGMTSLAPGIHLMISTRCRLDLRQVFRSAASAARIHRR